MLIEQEIAFIPDRLNEEPIIFIGMTDSELKLAGMVSVGFWVPVCVVVAAVLGAGILGLAAGTLLAFASMWVIGKKLRVIKRGRPKQFHVMTITAWLEDRRLKSQTMIRQSTVWDTHRRKAAK
jgi:conjugative transfer region protein (TIGR03750 family)